MEEILEYRQCKFEVGAHQHGHGRYEGRWSPTFKIYLTPSGKTLFVSGENDSSHHPETAEEAKGLAIAQVKTWIDKHWEGFGPN